ncbi:Nuclease SbcCD subunit D [Nocardia farcinica]|nr:Nuclease SbcCD subunit D [Nocardia farcinica]
MTGRVLHTSDWHLGRQIGRHRRDAEFDAVLDEIAEIAADFAPDLIVHSGDLFDGPRPGLDDMRRAARSLRRLGETAPVVVVAGNHDTRHVLLFLEYMLSDMGNRGDDQMRVRFATDARPDGVLIAEYPTAGGFTLRVGALPYLHPNRFSYEFTDPATATATYAEQIRNIQADVYRRLATGRGARDILVFTAHLFVEGATPSYSERRISLDANYAVAAAGLPPVDYGALGHMHKPQRVDNVGFPAHYAGSPLQLDFGETRKGLAAALGDTGAGKSSLLDAITFALFRKCAWEQREIRKLIADNVPAMSVDLTFAHEAHRWHVHRTIHRTNYNAGRSHLVNLDTGEETDGAPAVDARIKALLQMGHETFLRVGLLPQGEFDKLLTATHKDRSVRLRELFGADSLEVVQRIADRQYLSLKGLLAEANAKRDAMPDDPAQTAEAAGAAAEAAEPDARRLDNAIDSILTLQKQLTMARAGEIATTTAIQTLNQRSKPDATTILDNIAADAADLAAQRESLDRRAAAATTTADDIAAQIRRAEDEGEGRDALAKASATLENLAARAEEHRNERDRLAERATELSAEATAIAAAEVELSQRAEQTGALHDAHRAAADRAKALHTRASDIRSRVAAATTAARRVAETARAHSTALNDLDSARRAIDDLDAKTAAAATVLASAKAKLDAVQLHDRAAALAADLHPGDDCPVCRRELPAEYQPSPASAAELRAANARVRDAKSAHEHAADRLSHARAAVNLAETIVRTRSEEHRTAQQDMKHAVDAARRELVEFGFHAAEAGESFDPETASATLIAATNALSAPSVDDNPDPARLTETITAALTACEDSADNAAEQLHSTALGRSARIDADRNALERRKVLHRQALHDVEMSTTRHSRALAKTAADIRALPARIRGLLPTDPLEVSADIAAAAANATAQAISESRQLIQAQDEARAETTEVLTEQRALDQQTHTLIEKPLNRLRNDLDAWAQAAAQAITHLDADSRHPIPEPATENDITRIREYATVLSTLTSTLGDELARTSAAQTTRAQDAVARLGGLAADLVDVEGIEAGTDLSAPSALHPLVAAKTQAETNASASRSEQERARAQIGPAADLDFAITAGTARLEALNVLRRELVDARFLGHLTTLNTSALLGIASDLLGQLTDKRFGFAEGFDIVSRSTEVIHDPNRLSGGEKFLASLALALALAELHSYSGPRLGSLFLDEGFATLDTAALESALEVLRNRAGGDNLVMVISHLYAVAEAVDDVLWVQREPGGASTARWLTPAERDELVHADIANGLQTLA